MRVASLVHHLRQKIRHLWNAEDGNVAIIFAVTLIPLVGMTGGAIDYSRASAARTKMQAALDATALAMSKEAASLSSEGLSKKADAYFAAAFGSSDVKNVKITTSYTNTGGAAVTVTGAGSVNTNFLGILGIDAIPIGSSAKTAWGYAKLRVALVLDNSGSMEGSRLTALKSATKKMLTDLQAAAKSPGDIQVAIVPFNNYVNAGSGNHAADWIDWEEWDEDNGHDTSVKVCIPKIKKNGKITKKCEKTTTWVPDNHNTWNGCVTDRDQDYDVSNTTPTAANKSTLFPAEQAGSCPASVMAMGYDWAALNGKVDAMKADSLTNQPIGLAWGWMALTEGAPMFSPPITDPKTQKYVILLSDGRNTANRWNDGSGAEAPINVRQKKVCDNIKGAGIKIFSVLLIEGNETVMKDCASSAAMYQKLESSSEVATAFKDITVDLLKLRLTQ